MMKMNWREVLFWYNIYELQVTEEEIISELKIKGKSIPDYETLREMVQEKIQERRDKLNARSE